MDQLRNAVQRLRLLPVLVAALLLPVLVFAASEPLDVAGYMAFSYGDVVTGEPTGRQNESKLWWHDGRWWAILYDDSTTDYHIYRLDLGAQEWINTGVAADDRETTRADVLWDVQSGKLYVASHFMAESTGPSDDEARLYRYSYSGGQYHLDPGFPADIANHRTETMVLDKDNTGRLWVTFVSREGSNQPYQVYVNATNGADDAWGAPFVLPVSGATVARDDISSLIAFEDAGGPKIGVLWSNQEDENFYFATHDDGAALTAWNSTNLGPIVGYPADDHISMAATEQGELFAAIKTETTQTGDVLIGVLARDPQGAFSFHPTSPTGSTDTRAALVVHEQERRVYVFTTSHTGGGRICMSVTEIVTPLSDMAFPYEDCPGSNITGGSALSHFIASTEYNKIDDPTTAKHNTTYASGVLVLASDNVNDKVYVYNHLDTPDPDPTPDPTPDPMPDPTPDPADYTLYFPSIRR